MNAETLKELLENATPGPWVFSAVGRASVRAGDVSSGKKVAVTTGLNDNPSAENHYMCCANARLIALAPQLAADNIALQAEVERLKSLHDAVMKHIPMDYLQRHDAPGATGPTSSLVLDAAMRDYAEDRWKLIDRIKQEKAENAKLREAVDRLKGLLTG